MENIKNMEAVLNDFIKSLPDFIKRSKSKAESNPTRSKYGMRMIAYQGELTAPTMELWCNLMVKHGIPFADGHILDFHNDMYLDWETRFSMVYLTARYVPHRVKYPLELTWSMLTIDSEAKDGDSDEI